MRYVSLAEVLDLHRLAIAQTGGAEPVLDLRGLESAIAQPRATFEGRDLHPSPADKAAALCCSLILNHPFLDGNKLDVASGHVTREELVEWPKQHLAKVSGRR